MSTHKVSSCLLADPAQLEAAGPLGAINRTSGAEIIKAERVHGEHPFVTLNGVWQAIECIVGEADEPKLV